MLLGKKRGLYSDDVVLVGRGRCGNKVMVRGGRNKNKVVWLGGKDLSVYVIPRVALNKEQKLAMVVDMVKINAFFGTFYPLVRDLKNMASDAFEEHFLHLVSSIIHYNPKK